MTTVENPPAAAPDLDVEALKARYAAEREKRLREDGNDQYIGMDGEFSRYLKDPWVDAIEREPITKEVQVALIGGGFGGLLVGARLRDAGVEDLCIIEKGGDFGGTWYWNRYPGAMCDTEAYIYLPLLEEVGYVPTQKYATAPEILKHSKAIGEHYRLYDGALFQTEVAGMAWDEDSLRWIVRTNRGDEIRARFVVTATGPMNRAKLPGIPGIGEFKGHSFHTSRWDYEFTGGDSNGGLVGLEGKRVAVIGTGATAVQVVPKVAAHAGHLYLFQRTPSSIDVRNNRPTDPEWAVSLEPGWQRRRMENFNNLVSGIPESEDLVNDGWTDIVGKLSTMMRNAKDVGMDKIGEIMQQADFLKMNEIRARVDEILGEDHPAAEQLKPWYNQFCKRPCFHDEYLQSFTQHNVTLVDTDGKGVERITEKGIVVRGHEYEVDVIIYSTGFEVGTALTRRQGFDIAGVGGKTLSEHWEDGARTMHGFHLHGFPNHFMVSGTQSAMTTNYPHFLDEQSQHLAYIIGHALSEGAQRIEVTAEAEQAWIDTILSGPMIMGVGTGAGVQCTPGYYNGEGKPNPTARQSAPYPKGANSMIRLLKRWRDAGTLEGLDIR